MKAFYSRKALIFYSKASLNTFSDFFRIFSVGAASDYFRNSVRYTIAFPSRRGQMAPLRWSLLHGILWIIFRKCVFRWALPFGCCVTQAHCDESSKSRRSWLVTSLANERPSAIMMKRNELIMLIHCFSVLGVGVLMLLVLTIERYVSVCHPSHMRPALGPPR